MDKIRWRNGEGNLKEELVPVDAIDLSVLPSVVYYYSLNSSTSHAVHQLHILLHRSCCIVVAAVEQYLVQSIKERKLKYCGHVLRKQEESLEKDILEGTMPGTRRRGRPRISWRDNIGDWTGMSIKEVLSSAQDHDRWRRAVHNATKLRSEDV